MSGGPGVARRCGEDGRRRPWLAAVLASAVALLLAGCGGGGAHAGRTPSRTRNGDAIIGQLPAAGRPVRGGTITVGQLSKQTPSDIFPLLDSVSCTTPTLNFVQNQYMPLYAGPDGSTPAINERLSAAEPPHYSDADRTVTITLKPGLKWSDGKPVEAHDVVFYLDLLKAALKETSANWCQYSPGQIPDNIASWAVAGVRTLVLHLRHAVNPTWFTTNQLQDAGAGIYPLPSQDWNVDAVGGEHITDWATNPADALKIYDYLHAAGRDLGTFTTRQLWKVVDGPFALKAFSASDGSYELVPNRFYGLEPKAQADVVSVRTYANSAAMLGALESGSLDVAPLDASTQLHAIPKLRRHGFSVFGGPAWGWFGGVINYRDSTDDFDKLIAQPYMRGVLAELVDQRAIIRRVYHGWAVPAYGPVPSAPRSPYLPSAAARAPWPYDPAKAAATLRAHGWDVKPGGQTTCRKPGTGRGDCGVGIPKGTPIKLVWANVASSTSQVATLESQIFAADARRAAGIGVSFVSGKFSFLTADYNDQNPAAGAYVNDWAVNNFGGVYSNYYPTQDGLLSVGGSLNLGGYADARANRLMAASVASPRATAIAAEVSYLSRSYPVLYMPDQDWIIAVSKRIGGPAQAFRAMTQQQSAFQFLYRVRRK
jgi:peptide/nickel transport system substrate-binding protein